MENATRNAGTNKTMQHKMQHKKEKALESRAKQLRLVGLEPRFAVL